MSSTFATAINCMDGRVQIPVIEMDYVDMITEPGPNKILSENTNRAAIESIKRKVAISVQTHNSKLIAVVGLLKKNGYKVGIVDFVKVGLPFTLAAVAAAALFIWIFWS